MKRLILLSISVFCAGCLPVAPGNGSTSSSAMAKESMMESSAMMKDNTVMQKSSMTNRSSYHQEFANAVLTDGHRKVLFFYAAWCPYCRAHDTKLQSWYDEQDLPIPTYKVDYDSSLTLRDRYDVLSQHTFVLVDGEGSELKKISSYPSDEDVLSLITMP